MNKRILYCIVIVYSDAINLWRLLVYLVNFLLQFSTECAGEKMLNPVNIWRQYGQKFVAYFLGTLCVIDSLQR